MRWYTHTSLHQPWMFCHQLPEKEHIGMSPNKWHFRNGTREICGNGLDKFVDKKAASATPSKVQQKHKRNQRGVSYEIHHTLPPSLSPSHPCTRLFVWAVVRNIGPSRSDNESPSGVCPGGLDVQGDLPAELFFLLPAGGVLSADDARKTTDIP